MELNDNELMLLVKGEDLDKMSVLFNRHHRFLYNFFYQMTFDKESSEDVVQNTFYRMLKYRHTFSGNGEFKAWMFYLGRNALRDFRKIDKRKREQTIEPQYFEISDGAQPDERLQRQQTQHQLQSAMELLREEDREILVLSKFKELKYGEIARMLNLNEGTVKVRVHRAFNQLKLIYQKKGLL